LVVSDEKIVGGSGNCRVLAGDLHLIRIGPIGMSDD